MLAPFSTRLMRVFVSSALTLISLTALADAEPAAAGNHRMIVAQASETAAPVSEPTIDHAPETPMTSDSIPDPKPRLNKKRVAFWGVAFMAATSLAFVGFGVWAIRKAPKPGQPRPE